MEKANLASLLLAARTGSHEAVGQSLEACRAYLLMVAQSELSPALRAKGGASDLVQETFLEAHRDFEKFAGTTEAELLAWLRQVLMNNLVNFSRRYRETAKRDLDREVQLDGGTSSVDWRGTLVGKESPPSGKIVARETMQSLEQALDRLPNDYRQVIVYRYQDEWPFEKIATKMGRSSNAVRKLWSRAVEQLQKEMSE